MLRFDLSIHGEIKPFSPWILRSSRSMTLKPALECPCESRGSSLRF